MKPDCEICRGGRIVRLPVYRLMTSGPLDEVGPMDETSRVYPCPECGDAVKQDRVAVLDAHTMVDSRIDDPAFHNYTRRAAAHRLVDHLLEGDYIAFERGKPDARRLQYPIVATLGVVSKGQVATIEARATERGMQLAQAAADQAIREIDNWGSYYGHPDILKRDAARFIHAAVKWVSESWSKASAASRL